MPWSRPTRTLGRLDRTVDDNDGTWTVSSLCGVEWAKGTNESTGGPQAHSCDREAGHPDSHLCVCGSVLARAQ